MVLTLIVPPRPLFFLLLLYSFFFGGGGGADTHSSAIFSTVKDGACWTRPLLRGDRVSGVDPESNSAILGEGDGRRGLWGLFPRTVVRRGRVFFSFCGDLKVDTLVHIAQPRSWHFWSRNFVP